jgi:hypothetical protein
MVTSCVPLSRTPDTTDSHARLKENYVTIAGWMRDGGIRSAFE